MTVDEVVKKFIIVGKAIYDLCLKNEELEEHEKPNSITVSSLCADGKIIEITIAIKE